MKNTSSSLPLLLAILFSFTYSAHSQSLISDKSHFAFSINGGASILFPDGNSYGLFDFVGNSISMNRLELKFTYRLDRSSFSLALGQDQFNIKYKRSGYISDSEPETYREQIRWLGVSFDYKFVRSEKIVLFAGYDLTGNGDTQIMNYRLGFSKPIGDVLTMNMGVRYTTVFKSFFDFYAGSQLGLDYGVAYNF